MLKNILFYLRLQPIVWMNMIDNFAMEYPTQFHNTIITLNCFLLISQDQPSKVYIFRWLQYLISRSVNNVQCCLKEKNAENNFNYASCFANNAGGNKIKHRLSKIEIIL